MRGLVAAATGLAFACATGAAIAADIPRPVRPAPPPPPPMLFNWSGFYIGVNVGYSWGRASTESRFRENLLGAPTFIVTDRTSPDGIIGGGQIGFNWQPVGSPFVLGIEADIQGSGQRASSRFRLFDPIPGVFDEFRFDRTDRMTWFGTVRGRGGLAFNNWLLYVTGGLAYAGIKADQTFTVFVDPVFAPPDVIRFTDSHSRSRAGWTIGGGAEAALWGNISAKIEYLYMDFGRFGATHIIAAVPGVTPGGTLSHSTRFHDHILRVGLNMRF